MPDTRAEKDALQLQMQVQAGRLGLGGTGVAEVDPDMRLVRRLVLREPGVAIDAKQGLPVGDEVRRDLWKAVADVLDEGQRRLLDVLLVAALVGLEPVALIVGLQVAEELE